MKIESTNAGVYQIICLVNQKIYIGSAVNLCRRINRHSRDLLNQKHSSRHLQNAVNLYGLDCFNVVILEEYDNITRQLLLQREQYYLDTLKPWDRNIGYNTCQKARSPEQLTLSKEHKDKISLANKGRVVSQETRQKISQKRKGKRNSIEAIEQMRQTKIGVKQSEENIAKRAKEYSFIKNGVIYRGSNLKRFAEEHSCHRYNLNKVLQGIRKSHHGFFKY